MLFPYHCTFTSGLLYLLLLNFPPNIPVSIHHPYVLSVSIHTCLSASHTWADLCVCMAAPESWACVSQSVSRDQGPHAPPGDSPQWQALCTHPQRRQVSPSHKSSCLLASYHFPCKADFHKGIHQVLLVTVKAKDLPHVVHHGIVH